MAEENGRPVGERIVFFNGSYSVQQLTQRMSRVDWCIVPSVWWEIFCLVISEAWMFKRPVIASNVGGPGERVTHERDGLLFEVADPGSLAQAIRRACCEAGLWKKLVDGITPPASADIMAEGYLAVYRPHAVERAA
jgi:glycosyltransferase involved in cell wall biosynthesis